MGRTFKRAGIVVAVLAAAGAMAVVPSTAKRGAPAPANPHLNPQTQP